MGGDLPKQFIELKGVPIIIRTLRRVLQYQNFSAIVVAIHPEWEQFFRKMLEKNQIDMSRLIITHGGSERLASILNTLKAAKEFTRIGEEDVVVVHEAVRPFVSLKVLNDSVKAAAEYGACVATLPAVDTMLVVKDGIVSEVPPRSELFHGQAPDSSRLLLLERAIHALTSEERKMITGTAQICVVKGIPVKAIPGDPNNIKITTPHDLEVAERILAEGERV